MQPALSHPSQKNQKGFTLVEIMVASSIAIMVGLIVLQISFQLTRFQQTLNAFNRIQSTSINIINQMRDDLRWSDSVNIDDDNQILEMFNPIDNIKIRYQFIDNRITRTVATSVDPEEPYPDPVNFTTENVTIQLRSLTNEPTRLPDGTSSTLPLLNIQLQLIDNQSQPAVEIPMHFTISSIKRQF